MTHAADDARTVEVTRAQVEAALLRMELDKEDGLETPAEVVAIANARQAPPATGESNPAHAAP